MSGRAAISLGPHLPTSSVNPTHCPRHGLRSPRAFVAARRTTARKPSQEAAAVYQAQTLQLVAFYKPLGRRGLGRRPPITGRFPAWASSRHSATGGAG